MNRPGMRRLLGIFEQALDPARPPLTHERKLQLLSELYGTPRKGDLFSSPAPRTEPNVEPASQDT